MLNLVYKIPYLSKINYQKRIFIKDIQQRTFFPESEERIATETRKSSHLHNTTAGVTRLLGHPRIKTR
jgi:hypothetical protein